MNTPTTLSDKLITAISYYLTKDLPTEASYLCDFDRITHEIRPADVLLIEGCNRISAIIQRLTQSPWTHAVLYLGRLHDIDDPEARALIQKYYQGSLNDKLIIESIAGRGTIISPISTYAGQHIRICRPTGLSHQDAQHLIAQATRSLGKTYNIRHVFDLARFLFTNNRFFPRRWRSFLFTQHPTEVTQQICSAMIAEAFASVNFPTLPLIRKIKGKQFELIQRNPKLFTPSDFDYSPYFEIIKYPMLPLSDTPMYRRLPWNESLISHDEVGTTRKSPVAEKESMSPNGKDE